MPVQRICDTSHSIISTWYTRTNLSFLTIFYALYLPIVLYIFRSLFLFPHSYVNHITTLPAIDRTHT